jgi:hypothetical protein
MDRGVIYCRVTFKTPADINEATGGLRYYKDSTSSSFSGLYQILRVSNEFRGGKFTQTLETVRQRNQPGDGKKATAVDPERDKIIKEPAQSKGVVQQPNNINLSTARVEDRKKTKTKEKFKTPPVDTAVLTTLGEGESVVSSAELQTIVATAATVPIGDNSVVTGESIIGYTS